MPEFFASPDSAEHGEREYQRWLSAHPAGIVLSFNLSRIDAPTRHAAACQTIRYDLSAAEQAARSRKVCFGSEAELNEWLARNDPDRRGVNLCGRCQGPRTA